MNPEATTVADARSLDRRFEGPIRAWEAVFLLAFTAGILVTFVWKSNKAYFNFDELVTAVLVSNPSFSEMWNMIRRGGEVNPPLFFVLEWVVAHTAGTSELALRAVSGVSVALAGWVLFFTARPLTGPRVAALAVALVIGLSREVFSFLSMARYYGLLLLLVSLAAFLALRFTSERPAKRRDCILVFLVHTSLVFLHLYGLVYSGVVLAAMLVWDWLRGTRRWALYGSVLAAWATFGAWIPSMRQQLKAVSGGVFTAPGYLDIGFFLEQIGLETPMALVFLLVAALGALALISSRPGPLAEEANSSSNPLGWMALALIALGLMSVPIASWTASHVLHPPPYQPRYSFPCIAAWVFMIALVLLAVHRLPGAGAALKGKVPPQLGTLAWLVVLAFCIVFQPMRAHKCPSLPATPFVDADFGYTNLPIVFENNWPFFERVFYGHGRQYVLVVDHEAAEADPGWYTKSMERGFKIYDHYNKAVVSYYDELPDWPDGFLAVDDDYTKTFEWLFAHRPELKVRLLGTRKAAQAVFGEERIYLVQKTPVEKRQ
jgi:hypothetical protein